MPDPGRGVPTADLRILMLLHYPLDPNAGAAGYTLRLADALRSKGNHVEVMGATTLFERLGRRPAELIFPALASTRTVRGLRSRNFDVVDASTGDLWPCPERALAGRTGVTVTRSHGLEHVESRELLAAAERGEATVRRRYFLYYGGARLNRVARSLRLANGAIFCNEYDRRFAVENLGVPESRAFFVRAGLADWFLGLPPPAPTGSLGLGVAVIGPYMWRKGAETAAAAVSQILRDRPTARASWLGAKPEDVTGHIDPDVRARLQVVPHYENPSLPGLLEGHQILLVLSRQEGYPGAVLEGMACGLAVIASDIPGSRDILAGTDAGILTPPGDADAVASEAGRLFDDPQRLDKIRRRAHELAQTFSWREVADENLDVYRKLLERKSSGS